MKRYKRADRIKSQMLRDVQALLEQECVANLNSLVTFTEVKITDDLRFATIYYSVLGDDTAKDRAAAFLDGIRRRVQFQLGRLLRIKYIPEITFTFDPSIERGIRIERILNELADDHDNREEPTA
ncbi:MAG: 30S ribosome-binding factor RbfA [candidate division Zixibacteria bacterium]|nr:30S ribosome-binding factor RbfA [candidate division Zixibacteria bacterium]